MIALNPALGYYINIGRETHKTPDSETNMNNVMTISLARKEAVVYNGWTCFTRRATEQELKDEQARRLDVMGSDR